MPRFCVFAALAVLVTHSSAALAAPPVIFNLGSLGGNFSSAHAINSSGQIVGSSYVSPANNFGHGFLYAGNPGTGTMLDLGTLGGRTSFANALNNAGVIVGHSQVSLAVNNSTSHAFAFLGAPGVDGQIYDLGTLGGVNSRALSINNTGQIVGWSETASGGSAHRAFLYSGTPGNGGSMVGLATLGGASSQAHAINDAGQITGSSSLPGNIESHAFLYATAPGNGGVMLDLGTLGGPLSSGEAINAAGQIAGNSDVPGALKHPFLYTGTPGIDGVMHDLGSLGGTLSLAYAINSHGQVAGSSFTENDASVHAFVYTGDPHTDGHLIDLDAWLDSVDPVEGAKWTVSTAYAITDVGFVAGTGVYNDGISSVSRAFLLDASSILAVPEPSSAILLLAGGIALLAAHTRVKMPR